MSRLERQRRKKFIISSLFFLTILILLLIFIFTIGLKLLFNLSIFVAELGQPTTRVKTNDKEKMLNHELTIEEIPIATNSSEIFISGKEIGFERIRFYINEEEVKNIKVKEKESFVQKIGPLKQGENEIYLLGENKNLDKKQQTKKYLVFYKKEKPTLTIIEPEDKATVSEQEITIEGKTDPEVSLKVNNNPVVVTSEGNFQTTIRLKQGENKILFEAQDMAGNSTTKELTINYSPED